MPSNFRYVAVASFSFVHIGNGVPTQMMPFRSRHTHVDIRNHLLLQSDPTVGVVLPPVVGTCLHGVSLNIFELRKPVRLEVCSHLTSSSV